MRIFAAKVQKAERVLGKDEVLGSIPGGGFFGGVAEGLRACFGSKITQVRILSPPPSCPRSAVGARC